MAKTWKTKPSEILRIQDELHAYFLDRAVTTFGMAVEAELDEASANAKDSKKATQARKRIMDKWLDITPSYRDPMAGKSKVEDVPQKGVVTSAQSGSVAL